MEAQDFNNRRILKVTTAFPLKKLEVEGKDMLWLCGKKDTMLKQEIP